MSRAGIEVELAAVEVDGVLEVGDVAVPGGAALYLVDAVEPDTDKHDGLDEQIGDGHRLETGCGLGEVARRVHLGADVLGELLPVSRRSRARRWRRWAFGEMGTWRGARECRAAPGRDAE